MYFGHKPARPISASARQPGTEGRQGAGLARTLRGCVCGKRAADEMRADAGWCVAERGGRLERLQQTREQLAGRMMLTNIASQPEPAPCDLPGARNRNIPSLVA